MVHKHLPSIKVKAVFSECLQFRYCLTLTDLRKNSQRTVCVIMQNPSIADEQVADKSVQFLEKLIFYKNLAEFKQVGRILIVNQFARIQTRDFKGRSADIGKDNHAYLKNAICSSDIVLIAWGKRNPFPERQEVILNLLRHVGEKVILSTKKHPSRGSYTDFIKPMLI
ncbi:DUF1643 domain-containing protein [Muriicola soli]|uniref:DUF1643 domain-containing protein n=1 Tax=Muriicola soli TaxID=2507538 RepID=A0A411E6G5_9FLAO|nr:DUF1643 domain-containing protein [Muriicola soli]QBA63222.1 DUF1643 domain-containing protein [Muriicola soli]